MEEFRKGDIPVFRIQTKFSEISFSSYGAYVLSFRPRTGCGFGEDLLWVSREVSFTSGMAIHGGIPVCWPWFGAAGTPPHGIARISFWEMEEPREEADGSVTIPFHLDKTDPYGLYAHLDVNAGQALTLSLITENRSDKIVEVSGALHSYLRVGDISRVRVSGLSGCSYLCKVRKTELRQEGDLAVTEETDRIFDAGTRMIVVDDSALNRKIRVERSGSFSAVVWNPWRERAALIPEFGEDEYRTMLCVEAVNAEKDKRLLAPSGIHTLATRISLL